MSGFWSDDPVHRVSRTSVCDAHESDGIVTATADDASCGSCFFFVEGGCHNAFTSGLKMASLGASVNEVLCNKCANSDDGCLIALGEVDSGLSKKAELEVEAYASAMQPGNCPGFEQIITASIDEDEEQDFDSALFMGGF